MIMKVLKPWREIIQPHPDVSSGKYTDAKFAADLSQVVYSKNAEAEYQDPTEFFKRTFVTQGIQEFLTSAIHRLSGKGGDPVVQLKTSFGGGKTHTMLALYHLTNKTFDYKNDESLSKIFGEFHDGLPTPNVAVLVGTALSATKNEIIDGVQVKTLWGHMAVQIGGKKAFEIIRKDDQLGTAPGSDTLLELFEQFGPCLVIMDELVRYASNIYGKNSPDLNCSFDSLVTFVQNITEAMKRTKNSLIVAAIPESDIEMGGEGGKKALAIIENTFGRLEKVWKPVNPVEAFEIVRRRLFSKISDDSMRDEVCTAFSKMYEENDLKFPAECKEGIYLERLKNSYPIHPEIFDRLYDDWSEIETFQRTRGVLRLMASVIHELWIQNDRSLMIMPGIIPISSRDVRAELSRYLDDQWNSILDTDVDGDRSEPRKIDEENPRLGAYAAARRVSRTIFLGSAPSVETQKIRGLEDVRIRLGVVQPEEQIPVFDDALSKLMHKLVHLYGENRRFWFDTRTNLRRTVEDRASRYDLHDIMEEVRVRLETRERGDFSRVQVFPSSEDILDDQSVKLIVLPFEDIHKSSSKDSSAIKKCQQILESKGSASRDYKNTLIFVASDVELSKDLEKEVRQYLAWKSVFNDADTLDLKTSERKQAEEYKKQMNHIVQNKTFETYCWLIIPFQEGTSNIKWEIIKIPGSEDYAVKSSKILKSSELLISSWSPALLKRELDKWIWQNEDHIEIKKLWKFLTLYPYLSRLMDENVLLGTIKQGVRTKDFFGYANEYQDGMYLGLTINSENASIYLDEKSVLIKPEIALNQIKNESEENTETSKVDDVDGSYTETEVVSRVKTRFYGTIHLDWETVPIKAGEISTEIIQHLKSLKDSNIEISLEISGDIPEGIPDNVIRTISENCKTLKFKDWHFSEQ